MKVNKKLIFDKHIIFFLCLTLVGILFNFTPSDITVSLGDSGGDLWFFLGILGAVAGRNCLSVGLFGLALRLFTFKEGVDSKFLKLYSTLSCLLSSWTILYVFTFI